MGLKAVDMSTCNAKCRCQSGPNSGKLYNVEEPCPYGYDFDEENCDCPQPCDWCPDLTADPGTDEYKGRCGRMAGESVTGDTPTKRVAGFSVNVIGECDHYFGEGSLLVNGCGTSRSGSRIRLIGRLGSFYNAIYGGCPPRADNKDACKNWQLWYEPYFDMCGGRSDSIGSGLVIPSRGLAPDPFYKPGAFRSLWVVDPTYSSDQEDFWVGRLIQAGDPGILGNVDYYIGGYQIEITCAYNNY